MSDETPSIVSSLAGAVTRGEIDAFYQPQFDLRTGRIVAAEALARWHHPQLGLVPPNTFIPLAEASGLIETIGEHMIRTACAAAARWAASGTPIEVAVNVSATQLHDDRFAERLLETIEDASLDPSLLIVEVTESTEILDVSSVADRLDWLRSVGVSISVDDFGTGHSSVEQVLDLRATELKIDQSLVQDASVAANTLLGAVVGFAHDKKLRVVAEGVETEAQERRVMELGCDRGQGFLFGRPVPRTEFDDLIVVMNR